MNIMFLRFNHVDVCDCFFNFIFTAVCVSVLNLLNKKLSILQSKMAIAWIIFCSFLKNIYFLIF